MVTKVFEKLDEEQGNIVDAENWWVVLRNGGCVTTKNYNPLVKSYEKAGKRPLIIAERMEKDNILLNSHTFEYNNITQFLTVD